MLQMRTFKLDQPNYVFFNITWYDLLGGGMAGGVAAFAIYNLFPENSALLLIGFGLGFLLYWSGYRFYKRVLPYDSGRLLLDWYLNQSSFYEHRPDRMVIPLIAKSSKPR